MDCHHRVRHWAVSEYLKKEEEEEEKSRERYRENELEVSVLACAYVCALWWAKGKR